MENLNIELVKMSNEFRFGSISLEEAVTKFDLIISQFKKQSNSSDALIYSIESDFLKVLNKIQITNNNSLEIQSLKEENNNLKKELGFSID